MLEYAPMLHAPIMPQIMLA